MKMTIRTTTMSSSVTVIIEPELTCAKNLWLTTERHADLADLQWREKAGINWPAIGSASVDDAKEFALSILAAARAAEILNSLEDPTKIGETNFAKDMAMFG